MATRSYSGPEAYAGAFSGGATYGAILGATDGLSLVGTLLAGGASGAVQSATQQGISIADGTQGSFSSQGFGLDVGINAVTGLIPGLKVLGVTAGKGSFSAVEKQMYTKLEKGTLSPSSITAPTYAKMIVFDTFGEAPKAAVQTVVNSCPAISSKKTQ